MFVKNVKKKFVCNIQLDMSILILYVNTNLEVLTFEITVYIHMLIDY